MPISLRDSAATDLQPTLWLSPKPAYLSSADKTAGHAPVLAPVWPVPAGSRYLPEFVSGADFAAKRRRTTLGGTESSEANGGQVLARCARTQGREESAVHFHAHVRIAESIGSFHAKRGTSFCLASLGQPASLRGEGTAKHIYMPVWRQ